jgi:hypothetical protein
MVKKREKEKRKRRKRRRERRKGNRSFIVRQPGQLLTKDQKTKDHQPKIKTS